MFIKSYSKINLSLKVNYKLKNGLHEIQSFYCWINLFDKIKIKKIKNYEDKISFNGPFKKFVKLKNNSILNLLEELRKLKLISDYYKITVTKNIPVFGGLGGGTSNAAFILKYLLKNKFKNNLLKKLESTVGSDLRLFFKKQGFLKKLGKLVEFKNKQTFYFLLTQPNIKCSTKKVYSKVKKFSKKEHLDGKLIKSRDKFTDYLSKSRNDLQFIVEKKYPLIKKILIDIKKMEGCSFSRITGSGSVCYGLFKNQIKAKKALNNLKIKYPKFWLSLAKTV